jgi:hypothetical protein
MTRVRADFAMRNSAMLKRYCFAAILALCLTTALTAQDAQTMIVVDGRSMRVRTLGVFDVRRPEPLIACGVVFAPERASFEHARGRPLRRPRDEG